MYLSGGYKMKDQDDTPEMVTGWDARQGYTQQIIYRLHLVLSSDFHNTEQWFENVQDFHDCVFPVLKKNYLDVLDEVRFLIYSRVDSKGNKFKSSDTAINKQKAYNKLREVFRMMHKEVWDSGLYIPQKEKPDPRKAMMDMDV